MSQTLQRRRRPTAVQRRRRALLLSVLVLALTAASGAPGHLFSGATRPGSRSSARQPRFSLFEKPRRLPSPKKHRGYGETGGWPELGQGAYVLGSGRPAGSPHQRPVPIASVAKVMTAYLLLKHYPLRAGEDGRRFVVTEGDVLDTETRLRLNQSLVAVRAGEQLSERDALMAILLPSANNVAALVARQVSGSVASFVAEMNQTARSLGMSHTRYTDPSGWDPRTVSTALDQLRLARVVAGEGALAAAMATRSYWLPVAGEVKNTNRLLGIDGFVGMKTGSDSAAGGCLMFRSVWQTGAGKRSLIGVVLGQRGGHVVDAALSSARRLAVRVQSDAAATE